MIQNNRNQNRNRNRGRRPQGNGGRNDNGSRIDNRARGNAPQMLEKYKNMARDAQLQGDRVMTEYYLQFSDHYFRIVAEQRARSEETRRPREDWQSDEEYDADDRAPMDAGEIEDPFDSGESAPREPRGNDRTNDRAGDRNGERTNDRSRDRNNDRSRERNADRGNDRNAERGTDRNAERAPERGTDRNRDRNRDRPRNRDEEGAGNRAVREPAEDRMSPQEGRIDVSVLPPGFVSDGPLVPIDDVEVFSLEAEEAPAPKRRGRPKKVVAADEAA